MPLLTRAGRRRAAICRLIGSGYQWRRPALLLVDIVDVARALHPHAGGELGASVCDFHTIIVELPVAQVLEEVGLAVCVLECCIDIVADARPNGHVARIIQLHRARIVIDAPVQGATG